MKRADGKPLSKAEVIVKRRGAFIWLPVLCSNDLVHASWSVTINSKIFLLIPLTDLRWFTWGSLLTTLFAVYPLVNNQIGLYRQEDDLLPATDYDITWTMLIISGTFFTLGSLAFVHAFEVSTKQFKKFIVTGMTVHFRCRNLRNPHFFTGLSIFKQMSC